MSVGDSKWICEFWESTHRKDYRQKLHLLTKQNLCEEGVIRPLLENKTTSPVLCLGL